MKSKDIILNKAIPVVRWSLLLGIIFILNSCGGKDISAGVPNKIQIKLMHGAKVTIVADSLQISAFGEVACFVEVDDIPGKLEPRNNIHLVAIESGQDENVAEIVPDAQWCRLSADGKYALVDTIGGTTQLLNIKKREMRKIGVEKELAFWMGPNVVMAKVDSLDFWEHVDYGITAMELLHTETGKREKWSIKVFPMASDQQGKALLAFASINSGSNKTENPVHRSLVSVDSKGKIVWSIEDPDTKRHSTPVMSPSGKWAALWCESGEDDNASDNNVFIRAIDLEEKKVVNIKQNGMPVGVTNDGAIIMLCDVTTSNDIAKDVVIYKQGITSTVVKGVLAASVACGRVYYIRRQGQDAVLSYVKISNSGH